MIYLFRWLLGYVEFEFTDGFYEGFINACFERAIDIKGIALTENGFSAFCLIPCYKKLHRIALANGGKVHITAKKGLPFLLLPLKNRLGFALGAFLFALIISFLGCFIWNVELVGNDRISDAALMQYLANNGIRSGAMWSSAERERLAWQMMSEFDDIAWVHINKIGTTARVEINETRKSPIPDERRLKGIKALRTELEAVAIRKQSRITIKSVKKYYRVKFFALDLPLYFSKRQGDIEETDERSLKIRSTPLPVGITIYTEKHLLSDSYELTDSELEALAKKKLSFEEEKEFDGFVIINKSISTTLDEDKCIVKGAYVIREKPTDN